jgi:hypothetical protein
MKIFLSHFLERYSIVFIELADDFTDVIDTVLICLGAFTT